MREIILTSILLVAAMLAMYRWASPTDNIEAIGHKQRSFEAIEYSDITGDVSCLVGLPAINLCFYDWDISEWTPEVKRYFGSTSVSYDTAPIPKNIAENKWLYFEN